MLLNRDLFFFNNRNTENNDKSFNTNNLQKAKGNA